MISFNNQSVLNESITSLRDIWEATSFELELRQCNPDCVIQEKEGLKDRTGPIYHLTYEPLATKDEIMSIENKPKVAIIRQEGSNGDREMASAFYAAGFETWDVTVSDLLNEKAPSLDIFRGIVFVGGFSYADVMDSAKGWGGVLKFNEKIWNELQKFKTRSDTFSLGICNGCQLMALLGWIPFNTPLSERKQPRFLQNNSARFESRFTTVKIEPSPAIMLEGMEGSSLGIWVAHGEGRAFFPSDDSLNAIMDSNLAPVRYVDDLNQHTESYPFNPNGSPKGIASLCSEDGRHLAMMPHPERLFTSWQWPWMPNEWSSKLKASHVGPWLRMFQNARQWCDAN